MTSILSSAILPTVLYSGNLKDMVYITGADPGFGQGGQLLRPKVADVVKRSLKIWDQGGGRAPELPRFC